jgi:transposase-like protein
MPKKIDPALRERAVRLGMARESVRRWVTQADIDDRSAGDNLGGVGGDQATEGGESSVAGDDDILKAATVFFAGGASSPQR